MRCCIRGVAGGVMHFGEEQRYELARNLGGVGYEGSEASFLLFFLLQPPP
jgi:hypothetical protein